MTVGTKDPEIRQTVVVWPSVYVVELQGNWLTLPRVPQANLAYPLPYTVV